MDYTNNVVRQVARVARRRQRKPGGENEPDARGHEARRDPKTVMLDSLARPWQESASTFRQKRSLSGGAHAAAAASAITSRSPRPHGRAVSF
jgi:hypothetical protein